MRTCTSFAPAFLSARIMFALVEPRTMESSTMTMRLPATLCRRTFNLILMLASRSPCSGLMKVRPP